MVQRNRKQTRPIVKKAKQFYLNSFVTTQRINKQTQL